MNDMNGTFDGTTYEITFSAFYGTEITVTEGDYKMELVSAFDGVEHKTPMLVSAEENCNAMAMDPWTKDRIIFVFGLAQRAIQRAEFAIFNATCR